MVPLVSPVSCMDITISACVVEIKYNYGIKHTTVTNMRQAIILKVKLIFCVNFSTHTHTQTRTLIDTHTHTHTHTHTVGLFSSWSLLGQLVRSLVPGKPLSRTDGREGLDATTPSFLQALSTSCVFPGNTSGPEEKA